MLSSMQVRSVQQARLFCSAPLVRCPVVRCSASSRQEGTAVEHKEVVRITAASAAVATLMSSGNALAAQEIVQLADSDNRLGVLFLLVAPALGWVLFNIVGPASRQYDDMAKKNKSVAAALGLGAAGALAMTAQQAEAATQVAQLADSDNRLGVLFLLVAPALGWVLFNIVGPASRQYDDMAKKNKSVAAALGLGAAGALALTAQQAEAATQIAQLADSDNRLGVLFLLVAPALGWVLFNIGEPAARQYDSMKK